MDGDSTRRDGVEMALHLGYEPAIRVNIDAQRLADRREHAARKTHINDGAKYRDYAAEGGGPLGHSSRFEATSPVHSSW